MLVDRAEPSWPRSGLPRFPCERLREEGIEVSEVTARRAYDHAHRDTVPGSVAPGRRTLGRSKRLGREVHATIERLFARGDLSVAEIVRRAGCSSSTVCRAKRRTPRPAGGEAA